MTWMPTWQHFLKVKLGTCLESFVEQKTKPKSQLKPYDIWALNNQDPTLMIFDHILMVSWGSTVGTLPLCWDLLTWVGVWSWGPMWTHPYSLVRVRKSCIHAHIERLVCGERDYCIWTYESFIQHKNPKLIYIANVIHLSQLKLKST